MIISAPLIAVALASADAVPAGLLAPPPAMPRPGRSVVTTAQAFALAQRAEAAGDMALAERILLTLASDPDRDIRAEARFRVGQLRVRRGDWQSAADIWRALLDEKPEAGRVRLELAHALAQLGDEAGALRHLRRAQAGGLPVEVARLVERFDAALRSRRRFGVSAEIALAPDSNINRAGSDRIVDVNGLPLELDEDAVARSGIGLSLAAQAYARPPIGDSVNLLATLSANASLYRAERFNQFELAAGAGPEWLLGPARLRLRAMAGGFWFGGRLHSRNVGAEANFIAPLGRRSQIDLAASASHFDYRLNDAQDGWAWSGVARLEHAFSPRFSGRLQLSGLRTAARDPAFASWTWSGQLLGARDVGRVTLYAQATVGTTRGDAPFALPPARREDLLLALEGGIAFRSLAWKGMAPVLRISRTVNDSPVFFHDYARTRLEVGLTRDF